MNEDDQEAWLRLLGVTSAKIPTIRCGKRFCHRRVAWWFGEYGLCTEHAIVYSALPDYECPR